MLTDDAARSRHAGAGVLAIAALLLAAVNLRPAVTSLGPVLAEVRSALGMSAGLAGVLTAVPSVCFALVGFTASRLAARHGTGRVIAAGMAAVAVGAGLRPFVGSAGAFLLLTALALAGIAWANVLLPVVVKHRFPTRVAAVTGMYSMVLNLGAATAAAVTVPLATAFGGWRIGLAAWAVPAALAVPLWLALASDRPVPAAGPVVAASPLRRDPVAWALTVYFGLQSTAAYVVMGWLPQMFRDAGLSARDAGLLFAVTALLGVPLSAVLSAVVGRFATQSGIAVGIGLVGMAGYAGLAIAPAAAPWLWAVLLGVANCSFPLVLTMIGLRGRDRATVARLSAFAQSTGYLLSIPGPIVVGVLYEHTGGWRLPLAFMAVLMLPQLVAGALAGRDRLVG